MKKFFLFFLIVSLSMLTPSLYANKKLIILLDWFVNPNHAPLFVAEAQGYFKEQGLEVEFIGPADPADPPKLVAAGKADIAITYEPQFIEQIHQGLPLVRIANLIDKPLSCLAVLKSSDIHSIKDLKNKSIGYSSAGMNHVQLKTMLQHNGLDLKNIKLINVHYNLTQALLSHQISAATGMMRTFEVIQMDLVHEPARIFLPEKNGVPLYSELIFVTNKNHLHDKRLPKFIIALKKGVSYLKKHPEECWNDFAKKHPELNNELNQRAWFATLPYFADDPAALQ